MLKYSDHAPVHLFFDDTLYFITSAIYQKRMLLTEPALKDALFELIRGYFDKYKWELHHWVILDNHYHLIGKSRKGKDLSLIMRGIHRTSSVRILEATGCEKPVWWNYWDYCPRNGKDYINRVNYLLFNPIRHGYVKKLGDYPFSCFHKLYTEVGRDALVKQFRQYPDYKTLVLHEAKEDDF
ncbi:MAG: transposase [Desulfococcaceae bacterium]|jgi:putative transposase|nr:transposase [Desulfococcaceae bacterium]